MSESPSARSEIGKRIKELRTRAELNLQDLADEAGFSAGYLSEVERGKSAISGEKLASLAQIFHVTTDYLLTGKKPESGEEKEVKIPQALMNVAVREKLSLEVTLRLLKSRGALLYKRTKNGEEDKWGEQQWREFYDTVKEYFEDP